MATDQSKIDDVLAGLVPEGTAANYDQMARDIAAVDGGSPKSAMAKLVEQWRKADERGERGFDSLVAWGKGRDPGPGNDPNGEAYELMRAIESAKAEPKLAYQSHPEAVKAAEKVLRERDEKGSAADVDPDSGVIPNTGPVKVSAGATK